MEAIPGYPYGVVKTYMVEIVSRCISGDRRSIQLPCRSIEILNPVIKSWIHLCKFSNLRSQLLKYFAVFPFIPLIEEREKKDFIFLRNLLCFKKLRFL